MLCGEWGNKESFVFSVEPTSILYVLISSFFLKKKTTEEQQLRHHATAKICLLCPLTVSLKYQPLFHEKEGGYLRD
jgi:hypothetical protein